MKRKILFSITILMIPLLFNATQTTAYAQDLVTTKTFYQALLPYGHWLTIYGGVTVWHPVFVPENWHPYTEGCWVWTQWGWYWVSDEPFGWIVYHYGRWYYDNFYGWIWFPDNEWGPAWVEWRSDDEVIGLALFTLQFTNDTSIHTLLSDIGVSFLTNIFRTIFIIHQFVGVKLTTTINIARHLKLAKKNQTRKYTMDLHQILLNNVHQVELEPRIHKLEEHLVHKEAKTIYTIQTFLDKTIGVIMNHSTSRTLKSRKEKQNKHHAILADNDNHLLHELHNPSVHHANCGRNSWSDMSARNRHNHPHAEITKSKINQIPKSIEIDKANQAVEDKSIPNHPSTQPPSEFRFAVNKKVG